MAKVLTPLSPKVPIVDEDGNPTPYFQRIMQELTDARISASLADALGGDPGSNQIVTWDESVNSLDFKSLSDVLDFVGSAAHGDILYRGQSAWNRLAADLDGQVLTTHGAGANPTWEPGGAGGLGGCHAILSANFTGNFQPNTTINFNGTPTFDDSDYHGLSSTVTITIASPGVVTWTGHNFLAGSPIVFSTTGALPTGLTAGTVYYVVSPAVNTFQVSATSGGAPINTSGSQSGVHTATNSSRLTIPTTGIYLVVGNVTTSGTLVAGDFSRASLGLNGVTTVATQYLEDLTNAGVAVAASLSYLTRFTAGDYVELKYDTESDTSVELLVTGTHFGIYRLA